MKRRLISAVMATGVLMSFASCNLHNVFNPTETTAEITSEETTASEETMTVEETTTSEETATAEETTSISEETTAVSSESTSETTSATTTAKTASKKSVKKASVPSIPKGYKKVSTGWGKKYKGHVVYIVRNKKSSRAYEFKGWWKNKWIKLEYDALGDDDGEIWYNDKYCDDYYSSK